MLKHRIYQQVNGLVWMKASRGANAFLSAATRAMIDLKPAAPKIITIT